MLRTGLTAVLIALGLATAAQARTAPILYRLTPVMAGGQLVAVQVTTQFRADRDGQTRLSLPASYAGQTRLYEALHGLTVDGARSVTAPEPQTRLIVSKPGAQITVRYRLDANLARGGSQVSGSEVLPAIGPDRFALIGATVFSTVEGRDDAPVKFSWLPVSGWTFASDLEHLPKDATSRDLVLSVMMASPDLQIIDVPTPRTRLRVATFGSFGFTSEDFALAARKAIAAEQGFWRDNQPHFLVTLAPLRVPGGEAMQGVNLSDAFAMVASPGIGLDRLTPVLSHEYFHTWDPFRLGGPEPGGMTGAWFVEGFTDYYARRLSLRGGVSGLQTFATQWNTALSAYAASPKINAPNAEVAAGFWPDSDLQQMAYNRGAIFAAWLEAQWRPSGVSLDQVMIAMRERAKKDRDIGKTPFADRLEAAAQAYGVSARDGVERFIQRGETITLPADAFGPCLTLTSETAPVFDLGFDVDRTAAQDWVITGVDPQGPAYQAGLRDGMHRLERLSGALGDIHTPITYRLSTPDGEQTVSYLPQGARRVTRQQIEVPPDLSPANIAACRVAAAGI